MFKRLFFTSFCGIIPANTVSKGGEYMAKNSKQTSARAAKATSKVLRDGRTSKASKTAAGSALAQRASRKTK